jgi:hypothetical protein
MLLPALSKLHLKEGFTPRRKNGASTQTYRFEASSKAFQEVMPYDKHLNKDLVGHVINVPGDGNCLYHTIASLYNYQKNTQVNEFEVRELIATEIENNHEYYIQHRIADMKDILKQEKIKIPKINYDVMQIYVGLLRSRKTLYGGDLEIEAAANVLQATIFKYQLTLDNLSIQLQNGSQTFLNALRQLHVFPGYEEGDRPYAFNKSLPQFILIRTGPKAIESLPTISDHGGHFYYVDPTHQMEKQMSMVPMVYLDFARVMDAVVLDYNSTPQEAYNEFYPLAAAFDSQSAQDYLNDSDTTTMIEFVKERIEARRQNLPTEKQRRQYTAILESHNEPFQDREQIVDHIVDYLDNTYDYKDALPSDQKPWIINQYGWKIRIFVHDNYDDKGKKRTKKNNKRKIPREESSEEEVQITGTVDDTKTYTKEELSEYFESIGFRRVKIERKGDCYPLSVMAGHEIKDEAELLDPTQETTNKVTTLRNNAINLVTTKNQTLDGFKPKKNMRISELFTDWKQAQKQMAPWKQEKFYGTTQEQQPFSYFFHAAIAMHLQRKVVMIPRSLQKEKKDQFSNVLPILGEIKDGVHKETKLTVPQLIELLKKEDDISVIEHNGINHYDAWIRDFSNTNQVNVMYDILTKKDLTYMSISDKENHLNKIVSQIQLLSDTINTKSKS